MTDENEAVSDALDEATGLVSLKLSKKSKKEREKEYEVCGPSEPDYPYGTRIHLENESLEKLDIDLSKVGTKVRISAVGEVVEVSQQEDGKKKSRRVEIQIQRLKVMK